MIKTLNETLTDLAFAIALREQGSTTPALKKLGQVESSLERLKASRHSTEAAQQIQDALNTCYSEMGACHLWLKDLTSARHCFEKRSHMSLSNEDTIFYARSLIGSEKKQDLKKAKKILKRLKNTRDRDQDDDLHSVTELLCDFLLGLVYAYQHKQSSAKLIFDNLQSLLPSSQSRLTFYECIQYFITDDEINRFSDTIPSLDCFIGIKQIDADFKGPFSQVLSPADYSNTSPRLFKSPSFTLSNTHPSHWGLASTPPTGEEKNFTLSPCGWSLLPN